MWRYIEYFIFYTYKYIKSIHKDNQIDIRVEIVHFTLPLMHAVFKL